VILDCDCNIAFVDKMRRKKRRKSFELIWSYDPTYH